MRDAFPPVHTRGGARSGGAAGVEAAPLSPDELGSDGRWAGSVLRVRRVVDHRRLSRRRLFVVSGEVGEGQVSAEIQRVAGPQVQREVLLLAQEKVDLEEPRRVSTRA